MNKVKVSTENPNEIQMTRTFDAPRHLVIQAMTTPALIKRWLGGVRTTMTTVEVDLRVGGTYRYVFQLPDGSEFSFTGVYREVSDARIVHSERFNDDPSEALVTVTLIEQGGKTTMTSVMRFSSQQLRDSVFATGMADGAGESYDQLDGVLASLISPATTAAHL